MSRVGKKPIPIPKDVDVRLEGDQLKVKGPKGELKLRIHHKVQLDINDSNIAITAVDETREARSVHGLSRALINNMVTGVTKGFERVLEIVGLGYRAELKARTAVLNLGYSKPTIFELPE